MGKSYLHICEVFIIRRRLLLLLLSLFYSARLFPNKLFECVCVCVCVGGGKVVGVNNGKVLPMLISLTAPAPASRASHAPMPLIFVSMTREMTVIRRRAGLIVLVFVWLRQVSIERRRCVGYGESRDLVEDSLLVEVTAYSRLEIQRGRVGFYARVMGLVGAGEVLGLEGGKV